MATIRMANGEVIEVEEESGEVANRITKAKKATRPLVFLSAKGSAGKAIITLNPDQISSFR